MYLHILKRDLKRKKTMNIILLLFIILSIMFVSSSVNNILAVTNALDEYFNMAGIADYNIIAKGGVKDEQSVEEVIKNLDYIDNYKIESCIFLVNSVKANGKIITDNRTMLLTNIENSALAFFDKNNNKISNIKDDEVYITKNFADNNLNIGDKITIKVDNKVKTFTFNGILKDAFLGSSMMGVGRFIVSENSYNYFNTSDNIDLYKGNFIYINTKHISELEQDISKCSNTVFNSDKSMLKLTYIMDMIIAGILLVVSICLIIIALVILRFTISFTLSEEYKEIGIMKAMGIHNSKIRGLYMVKYFATSIVGAIIGFVFSIPFGNLMLKQVSNNIIIKSSKIGYLMSIVCSIIVVLIIILFCYSSTRKVKKFSPIDAIRSGTNGERYKRKGVIRLSKSTFRPVTFMAINDILSQLKHFMIMFITFTIGILLITIVVNTISTLKSESMISYFGMSYADLYLSKNIDYLIKENGEEELLKELEDIEKKLQENGIEVKCFNEVGYKFQISYGEKSYLSQALKGVNTKTEDYKYIDGTPPQNINEVAITHIVAKKIGANIGDTVTISVPQSDKKYIVSAIFQTMNNMGEGIRFHQDEDLNFSKAYGFFSYQIKYTDNPSDTIKQDRIKLIEDLFPEYIIYNGAEYANYTMGGIGDYFSGVKNIVVAIVVIINILVAVLMEKSFLIKEKGEIATLKAIGFKNRSLILLQTLRIVIIMILSVIVAILLSNPVEQITSGLIFKMMGVYSIEFIINYFESYLLYPIIIVITVILAIIIISQQIRKVSSSEINTME